MSPPALFALRLGSTASWRSDGSTFGFHDSYEVVAEERQSLRSQQPAQFHLDADDSICRDPGSLLRPGRAVDPLGSPIVRIGPALDISETLKLVDQLARGLQRHASTRGKVRQPLPILEVKLLHHISVGWPLVGRDSSDGSPDLVRQMVIGEPKQGNRRRFHD